MLKVYPLHGAFNTKMREEVKERNYEMEKELCKHLIERVKRIHSGVVYGSNKCDYKCLLQ